MNRQLFLRLFEEETVGSIGRLSVRFGQADFGFSIWEQGERLVSPIAIDTETELIQGTSIPRVGSRRSRFEGIIRVRRRLTYEQAPHADDPLETTAP